MKLIDPGLEHMIKLLKLRFQQGELQLFVMVQQFH